MKNCGLAIRMFLIFKPTIKIINLLNLTNMTYCCEDSMHLLVEILFDIDSKVSVNSSEVVVLSL